MTRGSYLGGHTVLRGAIGQTPRSPMRARGAGTGPEHEKRKEVAKESKLARIEKMRENQKLARQLGKQWQQERGQRLFHELTRQRSAERITDALERVTATSPGKSLAHALKAAFGERAAKKNES